MNKRILSLLLCGSVIFATSSMYSINISIGPKAQSILTGMGLGGLGALWCMKKASGESGGYINPAPGIYNGLALMSLLAGVSLSFVTYHLIFSKLGKK